jgi:hypothetical protein
VSCHPVRVTAWLLALACCLPAGVAGKAIAQQSVFTVPSPDVLRAGAVSIRSTQRVHPAGGRWEHSAVADLTVSAGLGYGFELGANVGEFDYYHQDQLWVGLAAKWRPVTLNLGPGGSFGTTGFIIGDRPGTYTGPNDPHEFRNYAFLETFVTVRASGTRVAGGIYRTTENVFSHANRDGMQFSIEQPVALVHGLTLAADGISGDGAYATVGAIERLGPVMLRGGYAIANRAGAPHLGLFDLGIGL